MSSEAVNVVHLNAQEIAIKHVTVFTDRAEIERAFTINLQPGLNEIQLENVAYSIEQSSIRVDGTGSAIIHEVKFECKPTKIEDVDTPKIHELTAQLKAAESDLLTNKDLNAVYEARLQAIDSAIKNLGKPSGHDQSANTFIFDESTEASIDKLFEYHEKKALDIKSKIRVVNEKNREYEEKINRLNQEINQLRFPGQQKNIISIQLENINQEVAVEIELNLSYQVYGAQWTPSYDIRVNTAADTSELKLMYYGNIYQKTGEDWNDVELQLSTASPGSGVDLPKLGTTVVEFYRPPPQVQQLAFGRAGPAMRMQKCTASSMVSEQAYDAAPMMMMNSMAGATENVLSTTFTIPVKKSIPSDSSEHKVTITVESLKALLHYRCVPSKIANVFLTALVVNDSNYPLLPGNASIYLNNSMSSNIRLKTTSCGEKFECPLGVDKTVKVVYKPTHKYQSQVGTFNKSASSTTEQKIVIKNHKRAESVLVTISEPIPKSADEKIKVKLAAPELKASNGQNAELDNKFKLPDVGVKLDDLHNLQWTATLNANEEQEFLVKWIVEYPPTEKLVYNVQSGNEFE